MKSWERSQAGKAGVGWKKHEKAAFFWTLRSCGDLARCGTLRLETERCLVSAVWSEHLRCAGRNAKWKLLSEVQGAHGQLSCHAGEWRSHASIPKSASAFPQEVADTLVTRAKVTEGLLSAPQIFEDLHWGEDLGSATGFCEQKQPPHKSLSTLHHNPRTPGFNVEGVCCTHATCSFNIESGGAGAVMSWS